MGWLGNIKLNLINIVPFWIHLQKANGLYAVVLQRKIRGY